MVVREYFIFLLVAVFVLASPAAGAVIAGPMEADLERVVDGDTVRVAARIWVDQTVSVSVRLAGVDAPEIFRPRCDQERARAEEAKAFVEARLGGAGVTLLDIDHDKYGGRVVARVLSADGEDIADALLDAGLAVANGARDPWCDD